MNKKFLLALSLTCASSLSIAQPTLTAANINPVVNDSFITVICDTTGVLPGVAGASVTWDFHTLATTLNSDSIETGNVVYAASAPSDAGLLIAAGLIPSTTFSTSTHAVVTPASSLTNYYIESATKLSLSCIFYSSADNAIYTDPVDVLQFPFTYGDHFTDFYAGIVSYASTTGTSEAGNVTVTADGWGTLILPPVPPSTTNRTFTGNVLRVHSFQVYNDTLNIFGSPVIETDTLETYTWYTPNYHSALLTIYTLSSPLLKNKGVSYARKQIANHDQVPTLSAIDASLKLYPNPVENELNIEYTNTTGKESVRISLCDVTGREIAVISDDCSAGTQKITYNTSALAKGMYIVRLSSGTETVNRKIEIQ